MESALLTRKITYTDEPLCDLEVVADFLPSPAELDFGKNGVNFLDAYRLPTDDPAPESTSNHRKRATQKTTY